MGLNLERTDLVVLSACETGVVDINSTNSVSALGKALKEAKLKMIKQNLYPVYWSAFVISGK